ncbi:MAG: DMT family transporter [Pseudomonadota bacterium]
MNEDDAAPPLIGYLGVIAAVVIWAGWIVATRDAMQSALRPLDVALFRYGTPALILAPVWLRKGVFPPGEDWRRLAIMTVGWGGPFVILISTGLQTIPASLFGPLVPGLLPMVVALWGFFVAKETIRRGRLVGLMFISLAVGLILGPALAESDAAVLTGAPFLLAACAGWSAYTIAYRGCGLNGLEAAAYVCLYSTPLLIVAALIFGTDMGAFTLKDYAVQIGVQGILSGIASVVGYSYAVKSLGLARASAFTSLVPVLAAIGGWAMLGEAVGVAGWGAAVAACVGVLLVNRYAR